MIHMSFFSKHLTEFKIPNSQIRKNFNILRLHIKWKAHFSKIILLSCSSDHAYLFYIYNCILTPAILKFAFIQQSPQPVSKTILIQHMVLS